MNKPKESPISAMGIKFFTVNSRTFTSLVENNPKCPRFSDYPNVEVIEVPTQKNFSIKWTDESLMREYIKNEQN